MVQYTRAMDLGLAKPPRPDTLTPEAEEAREMIRRHGRRIKLEREIAELVTDHGNPHVEPYDGPTPAAAKRLLAKAEAAGMVAQIVTSRAACCVEGYDLDRGVAFRAWYVRGKADGGTWHERRTRYVVLKDDRPVKVNEKTRTALAGYRAAGMSDERRVLVASPSGIHVNNTEIERRINAL